MRRPELRFAILTLAGVLLLAGCSVFQSSKPDDKAITAEIQSRFFQDPTLKTRDIRVASEQGIVVLTGSVESDTEKAAAERLASQVAGVKQVVNQLAATTAAGASQTSMEPPQAAAYNPPPARPARSEPAARSKPSRHREAAAPKSMAPVAANTAHDTPAARASRAPITDPPEAAPATPKPMAAPAQQQAPPEPMKVTVPAGTVFTVRLIDGIDSSRNHAGDEFSATIENAVVVGDRVVIPKNSDARVRLVESKSAGHMEGRSELEVELTNVNVSGTPYHVETGVVKQEGASRGKRTAETVGGGAGLGALIGAIAGKGKGAAIGAAIGAGAGTAAQAATHGQQVKISSESKLDFTLKTPITVTLSSL